MGLKFISNSVVLLVYFVTRHIICQSLNQGEELIVTLEGCFSILGLLSNPTLGSLSAQET